MCRYEHNRWRTTQHNTTQHHTPTVTEMCIRADPERCNVLLCQQVEALLFSFVFTIYFLSSPFFNPLFHSIIVNMAQGYLNTTVGVMLVTWAPPPASYAGRHFGIALFHLNPNFLTPSTAHKCTKLHLFHFNSDFQWSTKHSAVWICHLAGLVRMTEDSSSTWN